MVVDSGTGVSCLFMLLKNNKKSKKERNERIRTQEKHRAYGSRDNFL
ncbi:hypothetical protein [Methanosarcina sp.]|nr:hypothetical protein [Methanosarcina sp.]MDY9925108.1 hypothetical protein [Methanosarcina sp.]